MSCKSWASGSAREGNERTSCTLSVALFLAFCLAQLISSIIAAYGDWGFTQVRGVSGGWIGIVWVRPPLPSPSPPRRSRPGLTLLLFLSLSLSLQIWNIVWFFPLDFVKFGVRALVRMYNTRRGKHAQGIKPVDGVPITRTQSRHESLYSNRTSFLRRAQNSVGLGKKVSVSQAELQRFSSHQASASGAALRA